MKPNFFIIGAQKSASTLVQACLAEHPQVFLVPGEIPFFENPDYVQGNLSSFESLFNNVSTEKAVGIKRPNYYAKPEVPERLYNYCPDAKLILVLRNPVERAISAYFHHIKSGLMPVEDLEQGMSKIINGEYQKTYKIAQEIIDFGFYHKHLLGYLNYFDRSQIHISFFEDFRQNSLEAITNIFKFLEIEQDCVPESLNRLAKEGVYSLPRLKFLNLRNQLLYTYNEDKTRLFVKNQNVVERVIAQLIAQFDSMVMSKIWTSDKPKLNSNLNKSLVEIYQNDIDGLSRLIGRDLENWKQFA